MVAPILIAEDDPAVREFLATVLTGVGYQIDEAADGADVLARLAGEPPRMLLLDLHMPVMDGLEVLRRLRKSEVWGEVPVLFLTASGLTTDMVEARRLGARGYLVKPIRVGSLTTAVDRLLNQPELLWLDDVTEVRAG
jgi:Response regulator containing CheY-like receiver, AAA-type ATPase, and DNA-binding domains